MHFRMQPWVISAKTMRFSGANSSSTTSVRLDRQRRPAWAPSLLRHSLPWRCFSQMWKTCLVQSGTSSCGEIPTCSLRFGCRFHFYFSIASILLYRSGCLRATQSSLFRYGFLSHASRSPPAQVLKMNAHTKSLSYPPAYIIQNKASWTKSRSVTIQKLCADTSQDKIARPLRGY